MTVVHITEDGFLKFETVGGIDSRVLPGKAVVVAGKYPGVIGLKPIHLTQKADAARRIAGIRAFRRHRR